VIEEIGLLAQNMLAILGSIVNMIGMDKRVIYFDNEKVVLTSSRNHEAKGYMRDLDFLIILH